MSMSQVAHEEMRRRHLIDLNAYRTKTLLNYQQLLKDLKMNLFHEFTDINGNAVLVRLDRIAKVERVTTPPKQFPDMRTIIILFDGESGFTAVQETYEQVIEAIKA